MTANFISRAAQILALCTPVLAQAQDTDQIWTAEQITAAKVAGFDAETQLAEGRRLNALELLTAAFPDGANPVDMPAEIARLFDMLERAYFGHWVRLNGTHAFDMAMLSPSEDHLLTQKDLPAGLNEIVLWNARTGDQIRRLFGNYKVTTNSFPAFSHDGAKLALMSDVETLEILSTVDGSRLHSVKALNQPENPDYWHGELQFSADDQFVLVNGGDYRNPFSVVDATTGALVYALHEKGTHPTLSFANGVAPFAPTLIPFRNTINVTSMDGPRLCFTLVEAASRDNDWRTNEIENTYSGILDSVANTLTFDTVVEGRRIGDDALACHQNGRRLLKTVIDPELRQEGDFDEGVTLIASDRIYIPPRDNSQWLSGFQFSADGSRAILFSNRPAIIDTSNGDMLSHVILDGLDDPATVQVINSDGIRLGAGFTAQIRASFFDIPIAPDDLLAAARAEVAEQLNRD